MLVRVLAEVEGSGRDKVNRRLLWCINKVREERSLPDAIAMAQEAGRKYVTIASRVLAGK